MKQILKGKIVKIIDEKSVKVRVKNIKVHPIYKKQYYRLKSFLVQTESPLKIDDSVEIEAHRPISKRKKWRIKK